MWSFSVLTFISAWQLSCSWVPMTRSESRATTTLRATSNLVEFSKYEGLGNDFILIDNRDQDEPSLTPEQAEKLCNRNFGVGGDGVIFALKPPSDEYDFSMRIYNSDGSEPEMCGNGIRCFAQFLKDVGADGRSKSRLSLLKLNLEKCPDSHIWQLRNIGSTRLLDLSFL